MKLNEEILQEIRRQIRLKSFNQSDLYQVLKEELSREGHWKNKSRGKSRPPEEFRQLWRDMRKET